MAPTTPHGEPATARAGDSWIWKQSFSSYPVSEGWVLSYVFAGAGKLATEAGEITDDGSLARTVNIPAARTADLPAGAYPWSAYMTGAGAYAGRRDTVATGVLVVEADAAEAAEGDLEFPEERMLAAIDAVLEDRITDDVQEVTIAGRQVVKIPILELLSIKSRLERRLARKRRPGQDTGLIRGVFR